MLALAGIVVNDSLVMLTRFNDLLAGAVYKMHCPKQVQADSELSF